MWEEWVPEPQIYWDRLCPIYFYCVGVDRLSLLLWTSKIKVTALLQLLSSLQLYEQDTSFSPQMVPRYPPPQDFFSYFYKRWLCSKTWQQLPIIKEIRIRVTARCSKCRGTRGAKTGVQDKADKVLNERKANVKRNMGPSVGTWMLPGFGSGWSKWKLSILFSTSENN